MREQSDQLPATLTRALSSTHAQRLAALTMVTPVESNATRYARSGSLRSHKY